MNKTGTLFKHNDSWLLEDRLGRAYIVLNIDILINEDAGKKVYYKAKGTECTVEKIC